MINNKFSSGITFFYYDDFTKAEYLFEQIFCLNLTMDQGFAKVYEVSNSCFVGIVKKTAGSVSGEYHGGTLFSFTTDNINAAYSSIKQTDVKELTELKYFPDIPLKSFFFKDHEGHDFEIQEFLKKEDKERF